MPSAKKMVARPLMVADVAVSARMRLVRQRGTTPELEVRKLVRALGVRYRVGPKALPGRPDLANISAGWAIFVHGCFWHSHEGCSLATVPKKNRDWWVEKLRGNVERDARKEAQLRELGLRVLVVWQCELREPEKLTKKLRRFLRVE
jgi:DNA mismatch endonuclease, patch repair protein